MKRLFRIFELAKNEQRVALIVILLLIAIAFVGYERRIRRCPVQSASAIGSNPSSTPSEVEGER
jgi:hypothetical protein